MESQYDSIDIARLQRVALGFEPELTQPVASTPHDSLLRSGYELSQGDFFEDSIRPIDKVPSNAGADLPTNIGLQVSSPSSQRHYPDVADPQHQAFSCPEQRQNRHSESHLGKMSSAESAPGDTQVVSQSVFDSLIRQNKGAQEHNKTWYGNLDYMDRAADQGTFGTLREGDPGHIDLLAGFDNSVIPDANPSDEHEENSSPKLGESSPMHLQPDLFPESQRFVKTSPTTTAKERNSNYEGLDTITPVSRNPLPSDTEPSTGIMALSQVFKSTQAPSSPMANGLQSDPMSERPSPSIPIQNHSLAANLSSPTVHRPPILHRKLSEPRANHITMEESQAERDRIMGERMTRSAGDIHVDDQSSDEIVREPSFAERLRRQRNIDDEAEAQFAGLAGPARSAPDQKGIPSQNFRASPRGLEVDQKLQGFNGTIQEGGISEEETEQEDELEPQVLLSQELAASTEEDKENYNVLSLSALSGATSAHDRLSQALGLEESPSRERQRNIEPAVFAQHSRNSSHVYQVDEPGTSSQIIVRDSQPSAGRRDDENETGQDVGHTQQARSTSRDDTPVQAEPSSGLDKVASSPMRKSSIDPCPDSSEPRKNETLRSSSQHGSATTGRPMIRYYSKSPNSRVPSQLPKDAAPTHDETRSKYTGPDNEDNLGTADVIDRLSGLEAREKSSSMPSRVVETPVHPFQAGSGEVANIATIPETSPRTHRRVATGDPSRQPQEDEDDGLLPSYPLSQPPCSRELLPVETPYKPKLLSSPSGRQRKTLTDNSADASPQVHPSQFDGDVAVLTNEDRELTDLDGMSPVQPKKKRRRNNGGIFASDPVLPVTPRPATPCFMGDAYENEAERHEDRIASPVDKTEISFRRQSRHPRPKYTVWEIESSPQYNTPRASQSKKNTASSGLAQEPVVPSHEKVESVGLSRPAVFHEDDVAEGTNKEQQASSSCTAQIAPNQVLAPWTGQKRAYYPATCFGRPVGTSCSRYLVKFEDSIPVEVSTGSVKRLELRVGDAVKIDMPNVPKVTHIIRGFDDKLSTDILKGTVDGWAPMTDVYGNSTVILGPKQRKSLPDGDVIGPENAIKVPISRIYLDTILWNRLRNRGFNDGSETAPSESRSGFQTPSDRHPTPTSPSTSLSRSVNYFKGIFTGMAFAVSYVKDEDAKTRITKLVLDNGGRILREGFNELFEFPSTVPLANAANTEHGYNSGDFRLANIAEDVGFACVIADKHSRRAKYMQALALNLPCLSGRWIEDCVSQGQILDWEMYLLPAGKSAYLNGATKSRYLAPNPAPTAHLSDTITARPKLLEGQSVLLVMGRGRAEEKRKAYIFLTYALGASKVERVYDLKTAKALLDQRVDASLPSHWDFIYVDDSEQAAASGLLLENKNKNNTTEAGSEKLSSARAGKKRKRSDMTDTVRIGGNVDLQKKTRIIGNEFVCQSLILGRLFEA